MTHTPGPWRSQGWVPTWAYIPVHGANHNLICSVYPHTAKGYTHDDAEADARLIAAAPDLLRACELALAHVPRSDDAPDGGIHGFMERAIAKAKGE